MSIFEEVSAQLKEALRAKDARRLASLRMMRAAFLNELKKDNAETLSDAVCIVLVRRLEKQRNESIEAFEAAGREESAAAERAERSVLREFLSSLADEATTRGWVVEAIAASGAEQARDLGRVMGALMKSHKGDVDGGLARKIASEILGV